MQVCTLRSEAKPPQEAFNPAVKRSGWQAPQDTGLWELANEVKGQARPFLTPPPWHVGSALCGGIWNRSPGVLHHHPGEPPQPVGAMQRWPLGRSDEVMDTLEGHNAFGVITIMRLGPSAGAKRQALNVCRNGPSISDSTASAQ